MTSESIGLSGLDTEALGRASQRLFSATQWMLVAAILACFGLALVVTEEGIGAFESGFGDHLVRTMLLLSLMIYAYSFAIMGYRRRYWIWACVAAAAMTATLAVVGVLGAVLAALDESSGADAAEAVDPAVQIVVYLFIMALIFVIPVVWFVRQSAGALMLLGRAYRAEKGGFAQAMEQAEAAFAARAAARQGAADRRARTGGVIRALGLGGIAAVVLLFLAAMAVADIENEALSDLVVGLWVLGVLLLPVFALLIGLGRRLAQPDARALLESDERSPVLLLRSFTDDKASISGTNALKRLLYFGLYGRVRLEEAIADELGRLGPFIAIGQPGEKLPSLGAARAYFGDDEWRTHVTDWIDRASLVVLIAGKTPWVRWELNQIIESGGLSRLLLLLPPRRDAEDGEERWRIIRETLAGSPWAAHVGREDIEHAIALFEDRDGALKVIASRKPRQTDYEIAVRLVAAEKFAAGRP